MIANDVAACLADSPVFKEATAVAPGFLNLKLSESFLFGMVKAMAEEPKFGLEMPEKPKKIMIDYGGANVAKPLHVGHLRPAIIGESIKRISRYAGHEVIGDVHLGDWGTPIGMVIAELQERKPELVYFDENYEGEYPEETPITEAEFAEIYPLASAKSKEDPEFKAKALEATRKFQKGVRGYRALWKHIVDVSKVDLKRNYDSLNVEFDLWKGESDVNDLIPEMVDYMKKRRLGLYQRRRSGGGCERRKRHQGSAPLYDLKIRWRLPVQHHGPGHYHGAYAPVRSRRDHLYHGQAPGPVL